MTIKGYPDAAKLDAGSSNFATVAPVRAQQHALDVVAHSHARLVASDTAETGSTTASIAATAHSALRGDVISFTSGALAGYEFRVKSVSTNAILTAEAMPSAPSNGDAFSILRQTTPRVDSSGNVYSTVGGRAYADSALKDYSGGTVTTATWTQLIASTAAEINALSLFDSSGQVMELGVGALSSESRVLLIPPGGCDGVVPLRIAAGSRVSVRAVSANATVGLLVLTGLQ